MANENSQKKKGEVRLVKVNSATEDTRQYDAYGYEISREEPRRKTNTVNGAGGSDGSENYSETGYDEGASGVNSSRKYTYDADIRAAIESGAHRRTNTSGRTEDRTESVRTTRTESSRSYSGERSSNAVQNRGTGSGERRRTVSRGSHTASVRSNSESVEEKRRPAEQKKSKKKPERQTKVKEKKEEKKPEKTEPVEEEKRELTPAEQRKQIAKQKRRATVGGIFKVIAVILIIALIIVLISVNSRKNEGINTQYLSTGYIEDAASGTISFIRAETPVYSSFSGVFVPDVNEGDRVSKNAIIGHVVKAEYSETLKELKEIESRIAAALKASSYVDASKSGEMLSIENAIENRINDMAALAMSGSLSGYSRIFSELDELFSQKNELEMSTENTDTYIKGLRRERNATLEKIASYMHEIYAPVSGVVSFYTDGMEGRVSDIKKSMGERVASTNFTSVQSSTLTSSEYESLSLPETTPATVLGREVGNGTVVAHIATENSFYVTMEVDDAESHHIYSGGSAEIYIDSGNILFSAETVGVFYYGNKAVAVFSASRALDSTVSFRREEGRIIFSHVEGFKVPLRALTDWDSAGVTARITLIRSGYVRYAYVNVLSRDSDYAIVNSRSTLDDGSGYYVRENDEYVVNYDKVQEGQGI